MSLEIDPDCISNKLASLRADVRAALAARDAIDDCFCQQWRDAHAAAVAACMLAAAEQQRLAKNPETRYGNWRTPGDVELMALGYL